MSYRKPLLVLTCCLLACGAQAKSLPAMHKTTAAVGATTLQSGMSLEQAVAMVQARHNATVMRANTVQEDGRTVHYIRLMSADRARVWTVRVDAATGQEF